MVENYYTQQDWLNATKYSTFKIKESLCMNPDIQKKYPGIGWVPDQKLQNFYCPIGLENCDEAAGHCKFLTKESCLSQSGDYKDQGQGQKPYLEWHPELKGASGKNGEQIGKCVIGNYALRSFCEDPQSRRAGQFVAGVTNVPPFNYNQTSGLCEMTKPYCQYMGVGYTDRNDDLFKDTGINVPDCHEGELQKITEKVTGKVLFRGIKRGLFTKFIKDAVESGSVGLGPISYYEFIKKTINGDFKDDLGMNVDYSNIKENFINKEELKKIKEYINIDMEKEIKNINIDKYSKNYKIKEIIKICDPSAMKEKKLIIPNFGGQGINLYLITWKDDIWKEIGTNIVQYGFLCNELSKTGLPIVNKGKYKAVKLNFENTKNNTMFRRIYLIYAFPDWIFSFLSNTLINSKLLNNMIFDKVNKS